MCTSLIGVGGNSCCRVSTFRGSTTPVVKHSSLLPLSVLSAGGRPSSPSPSVASPVSLQLIGEMSGSRPPETLVTIEEWAGSVMAESFLTFLKAMAGEDRKRGLEGVDELDGWRTVLFVNLLYRRINVLESTLYHIKCAHSIFARSITYNTTCSCARAVLVRACAYACYARAARAPCCFLCACTHHYH